MSTVTLEMRGSELPTTISESFPVEADHTYVVTVRDKVDDVVPEVTGAWTREQWKEETQKGIDDLDAGRTHEASEEFFEGIKQRGRERLAKINHAG